MNEVKVCWKDSCCFVGREMSNLTMLHGMLGIVGAIRRQIQISNLDLNPRHELLQMVSRWYLS